MKKDEVIETLINFNKHNDSDTSRKVYEAINSAIGMLLSDYIDKESLTINKIIDAVNSAYKGDIMTTVSGERPSREEHQYRMIAYHFLYLQGLTLKKIGSLFNRNKSTICTTLQNFENEMIYNDFKSKYYSVFSLLDENNVILQNASRLQRFCKL